MSLPLAGADTVSKRNKIPWKMLSTASLDNVGGADPIPDHGTISRGPEKSTSRNRCCGGPTSPPRFWRSSFSAIHQCYCQGIDAVEFSTASLCVFIIIIRTTLTDYEAVPHMATNDDEYDGYYIPKGTILFGSTWSAWTITWPYLCLDCPFLGPYCMTPKFLTIPWSTSLNGIWSMEGSIQIWWIGTLWHLVTDAGEYIPTYSYISVYITKHLPTGRICPGRHLSDNSLYLIASCLLAVYDIKPPVDDKGNVIKLKPEFTNGLLT